MKVSKNKKFLYPIIFLCLIFLSILAYNKVKINNWNKDIEYLVVQLNKTHPNPYSKISKDEFNLELSTLKKDLPKLKNYQIELKLQQIIASLGDAHTSLHLNTINFPSKAYPINTWWFGNDLRVIGIDKKYEQALGCKLIKINNVDINNIINKIDTLISHENNQWLRATNCNYVSNPQILKYFNIINKDKVQFTFEDSSNKIFSIMITPEKVNNEDILTISDLRHEQPILKQKPQGQSLYYWYKYIPEDKILYFQYNRCMDKERAKKAGYKNYEEFNFYGFANEFMNVLYDNDFDKLIVDLRANTGGSSSLLSYLLDYLPKDKVVNKKVYVLISRVTFSAGVFAILTLKNYFPQAVIIGEETGGNLNAYGDTKYFTLPNCKANLSCSTKEFRFSDNIKGGFIPQITIEQSFKDYENGVDPIYDFVKNFK